MLIWIKFIASVVIIVVSGVKLSRLGDVISEKTGISRGWIGLVLLSFVTSLPELVTSLSAVMVEEIPNLSLGNVFGSNMFNMLVLVIIDIARTEGPLLMAVSPRHALPAAMGIGLMVVAALNIVSPVSWGTVKWIGTGSIIVLIGYFVGMYVLYQCEKRWKWQRDDTGICFQCGIPLRCVACESKVDKNGKEEKEENKDDVEKIKDPVEAKYASMTLKTAIILFAFWAAVTVGDGIWLASLGDDISTIEVSFRGSVVPLGATFVGSFFIAFATSLPEVVVSLGAVRLGAVDMAVGNVMGSNIFNVAIISVADIFYTKGPVLALKKEIHGVATSAGHIMTALCAILLTGIVVIALIQEDRRGYTRFKLGWYTPVILVVYLLGLYLAFVSGVGQ